jgi:hypothetical protein
MFRLVSHSGREMVERQYELFILEHQSPLSTLVLISKQTNVKLCLINTTSSPCLKEVIKYKDYPRLPP